MIHNPKNNNTLHALFGGTFDPIHYGHMIPLEALAMEVGLNRVTLLPNHVPVHRPQPKANALQRLKMVELAITFNSLFTVDDRELHGPNPSYTIKTLEEVRTEHSMVMTPLAFIIGQDSLLTLYKWHRWRSFLDVCHLLVLARPGYPNHLNTPDLERWLESHRVTDVMLLSQKPCGYIYIANTPKIDISSTKIRQRHYNGLRYENLLPYSVYRYIQLHGLYC